MSDDLIKRLHEAVPLGSFLIEQYHGSTWNDGGAWYTAIFELPDGTLRRVQMESDYQPDVLKVEEVRKVSVTTTHYEAGNE
jgi:hypothetical protein